MGGLLGMPGYTTVSELQDHKTTNRDFRLGAQRPNLPPPSFQERKGISSLWASK